MLHTALEQGYPGLILLSEATRWDTLAVGISIAVLVLVAAGIMLHQHSRLHELRRHRLPLYAGLLLRQADAAVGV